MDIGSILGSVLSGGVTGLIGTVVQRVSEYKTAQLNLQMQKEKFANDVAMKQADAAIMAQEWAARTKVAQIEEQGKEATADSQAFSQALTSEPSRFSDPTKISPGQEWIMVILDLVKALVRPVLTIYLCVLTTLIYWQASEILGHEQIPVDQAINTVRTIIETVLYLMTSCTLFYFGTRNQQRPPKV